MVATPLPLSTEELFWGLIMERPKERPKKRFVSKDTAAGGGEKERVNRR